MNHVLEVLVPTVPRDERLAWIALASIREKQISGPKATALVRLHDILVSVYPCRSAYPSYDPAIDECPWADARLGDQVGTQLATLRLDEAHLDNMLGFIVTTAGALGLTVFDKTRGQVHRPPAFLPELKYEIHVHGVRAGFTKEKVIARIARAFRQDPARIRGMFDTPRTKVKKGSDRLSALRCQAMLTKLGCCCSMVAEQPTATQPVLDISLAGGNRAADLQYLRRYARTGHAESQYQLGFLLLRGLDLAQDSVQGVKWIEKAAQQGHGEAQWALALCYREGDGVFKSYARALDWMRKAAEQGDAQAQTGVGRIYCKGEGVQPDLAEARRWFATAAAQGDSQAKYLLGKMLHEGQGGPMDRKQASALFAQAAQLGNLEAKRQLQSEPQPPQEQQMRQVQTRQLQTA